jgi:uncharacterized SAM-binding protein YcdF (DUF218 family)
MAELSFTLSKLFWLFAAPANLFALLLLIGAFLCLSPHAGRSSLGRILVFILAMLLFLTAMLPIGSWLLQPLENRYSAETPAKVDGIMVLSGDDNTALLLERQDPASIAAASRYLKFATLAQRYPKAKLAYVGGSNKVVQAAQPTIPTAIQELMTQLGIAPDRIVYETKSRNTRENAVLAYQQIAPKPDENWLLVTSATHMPRAMGCFRQLGWNVFAAPTDFRTKSQQAFAINFDMLAHVAELQIAVREYIGLVAYSVMGHMAWPW